MSSIAIYVEGGGDSPEQKAALRRGFDSFLAPQKAAARGKRLGWRLTPCGSRQAAYDAFVNAVAQQPAAINVLLVDSETAIPAETGETTQDAHARVAHQGARDGWNLGNAPAERVHLMVQCMEAWLVADPLALAGFYKQGFRENVLPARPNLEEEPKQDVYDKLTRATDNTQKGAYGKIRHARELLGRIDPNRIALRCPRFATFTQWLGQTIEEV